MRPRALAIGFLFALVAVAPVGAQEVKIESKPAVPPCRPPWTGGKKGVPGLQHDLPPLPGHALPEPPVVVVVAGAVELDEVAADAQRAAQLPGQDRHDVPRDPAFRAAQRVLDHERTVGCRRRFQRAKTAMLEDVARQLEISFLVFHDEDEFARHVDHQRIIAVDELRRLQRRHPGAGADTPHVGPQQHRAGNERHQDEKDVFLNELHGGRTL